MYAVVEERLDGRTIIIGTRNTLAEARELKLNVLTKHFELGSTVTIEKVS